MRIESRNIHLNDDRLMEAYFLGEDDAHLQACHGCRQRYDELARSLELVHEDAVRDADAIFTAERLEDQRERVLRRLERQGHTADVLRFPNRFGSHRDAHRLLGPARRCSSPQIVPEHALRAKSDIINARNLRNHR